MTSPQMPPPDQMPSQQPEWQQQPPQWQQQPQQPEWQPQQQVPPSPPPSKRRGLIIGLVVLAVVVVGVVGFFVLRDRLPNEVNSLVAGECFDRPSGTTVSDVQRQPCNEAHDAEVILALTHPADSTAAYPVVDGFNDYVADNCIPAFETYVGRTFATDTEFELGYFHPTITGWGEGDRGITCYVYRADGQKMSASVRVGAPASP